MRIIKGEMLLCPKLEQDLEGDGFMASIPVTKPPATPPAETVEEHFRRLDATWTAETAYLSSYTDIVEHPAFQEIRGVRAAGTVFSRWPPRSSQPAAVRIVGGPTR